MRRIACALLVASAALAGEGASRADEKSVCADKYQSAQRFRAAGRLTSARADLLRCAEQACPAFVSNDCKTWLAQVEAELPTMVFAVMGPDGRDVPSAVVRVDGVEIPAATNGLGHAVDPGVHVVEASANGQAIRQQVVARVGEKSRRVDLRLSTAPLPRLPAAPAAAEPEPAAPRASGGSSVPAGAFVLGGVALVGIGVGSVLWATGTNAANAYNAECVSTGCTSAERNGPRVQLIAGDALWGVGLLAAAGAVTVVLLRHAGGGSTAVAIDPRGIVLKGQF